ncbi:MAG: DNA repair protein RecO, partial [Raoultibacter sp.]
DLEHATAAAPMAELLNKVTQAGLASPQIFVLTQVCLDALGRVDACFAPSITAAHLLKSVSFAGFRPALSRCAICGDALASEVSAASTSMARVSYAEGGRVCATCAPHANTVAVSAATCQWAHTLLHATIEEVVALRVDPRSALAVLQFCHPWIGEHVGTQLKSLKFLFASNLF